MQRFDEGQLIHELGHLREQLADPSATLPMLLELPRTPQQIRCRSELHSWFVEWQRLAVVARQQRFVVERVNLGNAAVHEQEDDPLGPHWQGRSPRAKW